MIDSIRHVLGSGDEKTTGWFVDWREQWSQLVSPGSWNWVDFEFVAARVEWAPYTQRWEVELGLLGLGVRVTYVWADDFNAEMRRRMQEVIDDPERASTLDEVISRTAAGRSLDAGLDKPNEL